MDDANMMAPVPSEETAPAKKRQRRGSLDKRKKDSIKTEEQRVAVESNLREIMVEVNQAKVMSDNQLRDRFNSYLMRCYQNRQYPTVEEGFLATGYTRQYLMSIAQGKSRGRYFTPEAVDIINRFLDICAAFDAKMVMSGNAPMIGYIFRSKQHYGYSDKTTVQLAGGNQNIETDLSVNDIAKRYNVETSFVEDENDTKTN